MKVCFYTRPIVTRKTYWIMHQDSQCERLNLPTFVQWTLVTRSVDLTEVEHPSSVTILLVPLELIVTQLQGGHHRVTVEDHAQVIPIHQRGNTFRARDRDSSCHINRGHWVSLRHSTPDPRPPRSLTEPSSFLSKVEVEVEYGACPKSSCSSRRVYGSWCFLTSG